ncbi:9.3 kDa protein [Cordyline virus 2]|uniref:9.3 kDa protein n=1 Tax=Cordyline virus 2 TaxID=1177751 RepID=L7P042_9CLOS|nr:9.3 kDa protein [Cordyline virus 2]AFJ05049.1 9.3 kDa protein [Cordyline virus 2]
MEEVKRTLKSNGKTVYKFKQEDPDCVMLLKVEESSFMKMLYFSNNKSFNGDLFIVDEVVDAPTIYVLIEALPYYRVEWS